MAEPAFIGTWPLYLLGSGIVFLGFLALHTWIRGLTGRASEKPAAVLAASAVAFVLGAATIGLAIRIDDAQTTAFNTRLLVYEVDVRINGSAPVRLILPAPGEPGFFSALNVTNGSSSMRVLRGPDPSVEVVAFADVRFEVRYQVVTLFFNDTFTRVLPVIPPDSQGRNANMTVDMVADGPDTTTVDLDLRIELIGFCGSTTFEFSDVIPEGTSVRMGTLTFAVC